VDELESSRLGLVETIQTLIREVESETAEVKVGIMKFLAAEKKRLQAESRDSIEHFTETARGMVAQAEKKHAASLQSEASRFRSNFVSELDRVGANAAAELSLWSNQKSGQARGALESSMEATNQRFIEELKKAEEEFRVALECRKAALIDRYGASAEKYLNDALTETKRMFKAEMEARGRDMLPGRVEELRQAMDESADGILAEFGEAARRELAAALANLHEDTARKLDAAMASATKSIEEVSKSIERDIAELKASVAEQTLRLRDQLRREEDFALEQTGVLRAGVEDALASTRDRVINIVGRYAGTLTKLDQQIRKLEGDARVLESRRVSIDAKLASLAQNFDGIEASNERLIEWSLQLSQQMETSLGAIEGEAAAAREYLTNVNARLSKLRAGVEEAINDYEARVEAARRELGTMRLEKATEEMAERARQKMDAELEYRLLSFRRELKDIEEEVLRRAAAAERSMVREATMLVRSRRSELYVNKISQQRQEGEGEKKMKHLMCESCGKRLRYIPQYGRWYCDFCRKYAPKGIERSLEKTPESELMRWYQDVWKQPDKEATT
jgi:ribosomal protein L37AE/L43A